MRRHILGILAISSLLLGLVLTVWPPQQLGYAAYQAGAFRLGAFLVVLWLAFPQVVHMPTWMLGVIPAMVVLLAVRPRWFLYALPVVILLMIFRPRHTTARR